MQMKLMLMLLLLRAPSNAGTTEVIHTRRSPSLKHYFWKTFVCSFITKWAEMIY